MKIFEIYGQTLLLSQYHWQGRVGEQKKELLSLRLKAQHGERSCIAFTLIKISCSGTKTDTNRRVNRESNTV